MPTELTDAQLRKYRETGVLHLENAFSSDVALRLQDQIWEWARTLGVRREDSSTWWTGPWGWIGGEDRTKGLRSREMKSERLTRAVRDLLGEGTWTYPADFGGLLVDPPNPEPGRWTVGGAGWHWDHTWRGELHPSGRVNSFHLLGEMDVRGGGTLLVEGSHLVLHEFHCSLGEQAMTAKRKGLWNMLTRDSEYFGSLQTQGLPDDPDRFLEPRGGLRVVEVTGRPGDVWFWHPMIVHRRPPYHHGRLPRFQVSRAFGPPPGTIVR